jgi:uncharacterized protein
MTRVVIDANVLASATAGHPDSPSRRLLDAIASDRIEAVLCDRILQELDRALQRPYFVARVTAVERRTVGAVLRAAADMLPDPVAPLAVVRDPRDDYLVALARAAAVDAIVTGDRDLLDHARLEPPAITPRTACERFGLA